MLMCALTVTHLVSTLAGPVAHPHISQPFTPGLPLGAGSAPCIVPGCWGIALANIDPATATSPTEAAGATVGVGLASYMRFIS